MGSRGIAGVVADPLHNVRAQVLAQRLGVCFFDTPPAQGLILEFSAGRVQLRDAAQPATRPITVDFAGADIQRRLRAGKRGDLARAIGLARRPGLSVFDATCGLGRDAAVLMGLGCIVQACERNPVLAALLADGLQRAGPLPRWRGLIEQDAHAWLAAQGAPVADVIYLDPMFGGARSALPKWEMQALHEIAGSDEDAAQLLASARSRARQRVVLKRHPKGAELAPPDFQQRGKRARFDIYLTGDSDCR